MSKVRLLAPTSKAFRVKMSLVGRREKYMYPACPCGTLSVRWGSFVSPPAVAEAGDLVWDQSQWEPVRLVLRILVSHQ